MTKRFMTCVAILGFAVSLSGCKKYIDHVEVKLADNLETVRVAMVFSKDIHSTLEAGFAMKTYGYLFLSPYTSSTPFEIGFDLNTSIVNEQDYVHMNPTMALPNGMPLGVDYPLVQVNAPEQLGQNFDVFGYVDVTKLSWLGVAAMFKFMSDQYFPENLVLTQGFNPSSGGKDAILCHVFGPTLNSDGTLKRAGGIAVLANVRQLIQSGKLEPGKSTKFKPSGDPVLSGAAAPEYLEHPAKLQELGERLVEGLNSQN